MAQPLFFEPEPYLMEKTATETELPEDPNLWPQELLQELYKQVPYISDFEPHVQMDRVDGEKGYGFGHVQVQNQTEAEQSAPSEQLQSAGVRSVRIPVIIKGGKLQPFDVIVTDNSKMLPLTEGRLRQAIFRPQAFDVTSRTPGDQSMIAQLYPPYRQNTGIGSGVSIDAGAMGKMASAFEEYLAADKLKHGRVGKITSEGNLGDGTSGVLEDFVGKHVKEASADAWGIYDSMQKKGSILEAIISTVNESDYVKLAEALESPSMQGAVMKNMSGMGPALAVLSTYSPTKLASVESLISPNVIQIRRGAGEYIVKTANTKYWQPKLEKISRGEAVERFGEKVVLAADTEGSATAVKDEGVSEEEDPRDEDTQGSTAIAESGLYKVLDAQGNEHIGMVIVGLLDCDGTLLPLSLFTNGSKAAVQADMVGQPAGQAFDLPTGDLGQNKGYGFFFTQGAQGEIQATVPMDISSSTQGPDGTLAMQGETFDGAPCEISVQPNVQTVVQTPDGRTLIPEGWQWSPLESADHLNLSTTEGEEEIEPEAKLSMASVFVRSDGSTFSFEGPAISKLGAAETRFLNLDDATFLLGALGANLSYGMKKLGESYNGREPVRIRVGRVIEPAGHQKHAALTKAAQRKIINWRKDLVKEATSIPDPVAVDTVLSLGFLSPENVTTFVSYLPVLEEAQSKLCEILVSARLGLQNIPTTALERSVRSIEEVLEGLKILAFQGG